LYHVSCILICKGKYNLRKRESEDKTDIFITKTGLVYYPKNYYRKMKNESMRKGRDPIIDYKMEIITSCKNRNKNYFSHLKTKGIKR
jgi:hypothetical protein